MSKKINLRKRSPIAWLLLALFIPFMFLYWLASSHKQINQIGQQGGGETPIRMSPWWPISLVFLSIILIAGAITVVIVGDVEAEGFAVSPVAPVSAQTEADEDDTYQFTETTTVTDLENNIVSQSESLTIDSEGNIVFVERTSAENAALVDDSGEHDWIFFTLYFLGLVVGLAHAIVLFFYLLQHSNAIVKISGSDEDKTILIVFSAIGCFVFAPLLVGVVYKSQEAINKAIDNSSPQA